ncbi:MAG: S41 family peptidase [Gammaproteobacteria bacterium]
MSALSHPVSGHVHAMLVGALCYLITVLSGCASIIAPGHAVPKNPYAYQFEEYWYKFDRLYPYFDYKHVDWQAAYDQYRLQADKVTNEAQLVALLIRMTKPLRDVHVWFKSPDGKYLTTYNPARASDPNWDPTVIDKYVPDLSYYGGADWGFGHIKGYAYIFIADWNKHALSLNEFDTVLTRFTSSRGLILDVRMNEGGDEAMAYKLAAHFTDTPKLTEYYRYRNGPLPDDLGSPRPKYLNPSLGFHYTGPVMLLIGSDSFSSTENFIAAMQTLPNVTTIGETTGGASGCPETYKLAKGWQYSVPVCYDMTSDHKVIEWNGIQPKITVTTTPADFRRGQDPVLGRALELLQKQSGPAHPDTILNSVSIQH